MSEQVQGEGVSPSESVPWVGESTLFVHDGSSSPPTQTLQVGGDPTSPPVSPTSDKVGVGGVPWSPRGPSSDTQHQDFGPYRSPCKPE